MRIHPLLDLPSAIRKGDFVHSLAKGIDQPAETVATYAVTPNLVQAFDRALSVIDSALRSQRSQAVYLHGSFGSGKSHYLTMLDLLLQPYPPAWERPELHPLRSKYTWAGTKKLLRLPMHMIGAQSMEQKIFETYVHHIQTAHPDAPHPALYADQDLFENAAALRIHMGDESYFARLNEKAPAPAVGWGKLAQTTQWTAERFENALTTPDAAERAALFSVLVKTLFPAFARQTSQFIELDRGLAVMSRHAAALSYEAVILYLDELILWLAGRFANMDFVQNEVQKMAKLKEAQDEKRDVPIVSYIARQRDLSELVGDQAVGIERTTLRDNLSWSTGRFETIVLDDRNLPAIVERRVLRPKDDEAAEALADGFVKMRKGLGNAWGTLLGSAGEEADFRKVYPFSPALVETLVALSDCLQRERTAIRILMELLVEHLTELETGQVVPLGDVFDVIAGGEDAFDSVMRERFDQAKHLYRTKLLPMIQNTHGTTTREACQRLRDEHPQRLGCSGCSQSACRNDNRLAKTLLIAALVPQTPLFKELSVKEMVHLNHGTVATPIPGTEVQLAVDKVRNWATQVGQLRVGDAENPRVSLRLEGVDLKPILDGVEGVDNMGSRRRLLQNVLFSALELPTDGGGLVTHKVQWRGTRRQGVVRFGNVREMPDSALTCPADAQWYVVIDYPFDELGFGPEDDLKHLEAFLDKPGARGSATFVWLPTFFTEKLERELGELTKIEHLLMGDNLDRHVRHLRPEDQARARRDLESLGNQKRALITRAITQAYGIASPGSDELLDASRKVDEHVVSLQPDLEARRLLAGSFRDGLEQLAERLLEHRYPHHPRFGAAVTAGKLERALRLVERMLEAPDRRLAISRDEHKDLRDFALPLGLTQLGESAAVLGESRLREVEQQRQRAGVETPTVEQVRQYVDPEGNLGLTPTWSAARWPCGWLDTSCAGRSSPWARLRAPTTSRPWTLPSTSPGRAGTWTGPGSGCVAPVTLCSAMRFGPCSRQRISCVMRMTHCSPGAWWPGSRPVNPQTRCCRSIRRPRSSAPSFSTSARIAGCSCC